MMGMQAAPEQLFYDFCLEDHVPGENMLRRIDDFLDLDDIRRELKPFYCAIGRPSIASAFAPSVGFVRRFISIWLIAGSAGWGLMARCRIIQPSR